MKLEATSNTIGEFREIKATLVANRSRLQDQLSLYPLVVTFAEYRYVLENMEDFESLISDINEAIVQQELHPKDHIDMTRHILQCDPGTHKYEPRYDSRLSEHSANRPRARDMWQTLEEQIPLDQIYVHDICVQCGNIVKRD